MRKKYKITVFTLAPDEPDKPPIVAKIEFFKIFNEKKDLIQHVDFISQKGIIDTEKNLYITSGGIIAVIHDEGKEEE